MCLPPQQRSVQLCTWSQKKRRVQYASPRTRRSPRRARLDTTTLSGMNMNELVNRTPKSTGDEDDDG